MKFIPQTIDELLDERIEFCQTLADNFKITQSNQMSDNVFDFIKHLSYLKYCKSLDRNSTEFKELSEKIILDLIHVVEKQEHECLIVHGEIFPTQKKSYLSSYKSKYFHDLKLSLEKIYNSLC